MHTDVQIIMTFIVYQELTLIEIKHVSQNTKKNKLQIKNDQNIEYGFMRNLLISFIIVSIALLWESVKLILSSVSSLSCSLSKYKKRNTKLNIEIIR